MQTTTKSIIIKPLQGKGGTTLLALNLNWLQLHCVIAECLLISSAQTLTIKSLICETFTQNPKLLQTLALVLTTKGKVLKPYWNAACLVRSSLLWLPTKTVLQDLESNSSNGYYNNQVLKSWFSITKYSNPNENSQKTSLLSSTSLAVGSTAKEGISITKCKKIRVFPSTEQKKILAQWFGISRVAYNASIVYLKQDGIKANFMANKSEIYHSLPEWSSFCPSHIRQYAIKDAHEALKAQKVKCKKTGKPFSMSFRSRKDTSQIIKFSKADFKNGLYKTKLGFLKLAECLPEGFCDASLTLNNGQYHLNVPYKITVKPADNQGKLVALDPGVRTFITYYSENSCGKIGDLCIGRIYRLCQHLDNLMSRKLWKPASKLRVKIKNLVSELHNQSANFLTKNFSTILIPAFETSQMVSKKAGRKIRTKTARAMMTCSHYAFRLKLINKALENGSEVKVVTEEYTSKTASWTGELINVGSSKQIKSNNIVLDRDINGARGILLKALVDSPDLCKKVASVNFS